MNTLVLDAMRLAERAHRTRPEGPHHRKAPEGEDRPAYFIHLAEVGWMLQDAGLDAEIVAAGYLHDVIEDCGYTQDLSEAAIRESYTRFKAEKNAKELATLAAKHGLATAALQTFVDGILDRMIFDGEQLSDLMAPLDLGWKARTQAELALMEDLHPLLTKRAGGRDISGLSAYE